MIIKVDANDWEINTNDLWYQGPGFYYVDETSGLIGPFATENSAQQAFTQYAGSL